MVMVSLVRLRPMISLTTRTNELEDVELTWYLQLCRTDHHQGAWYRHEEFGPEPV